MRTGPFWGSHPDPAVVVEHLDGGSPEPPPSDWDVGHFVELAALVRGPGGAFVIVRDTYRELGRNGHHLQPPERVAAALRRDDGAEGGVLVVCAAAAADGLRETLRDAGLRPARLGQRHARAPDGGLRRLRAGGRDQPKRRPRGARAA